MKIATVMTRFKQFCCLLLCLFASLAWGQVKVLSLPDSGVYDKPLNFKDDSIEIKRNRILAAEFLISHDANFYKAKFKSKADFSHAGFQNKADFSHAEFQNETNFNDAEFQNIANFNDAKFQNIANFWGAKFQYDAHFNKAKFQNIAKFRATNFQDGADFSGAVFRFGANFNHLTGKEKIIFFIAEMPTVLFFEFNDSLKADFRGTYINHLDDQNAYYTSDIAKKDPFLQLSQKYHKCVILLKGTNLANIILPYEQFWVDVSDYGYEEKTALYEKLIKVCKDEGMDDSVEGWSIELKKVETLYKSPIMGAFYNWFQAYFWNFGCDKWYILLWIFGVFGLFTLLNLLIYPKLVSVYFNPKLGTNLFTTQPTSAHELIASLKKSNFARLRYVLHYTGVIFFGLKLEHTDLSFKHLRWVAVLYFQFIVGLILLGFAVNFVLSK